MQCLAAAAATPSLHAGATPRGTPLGPLQVDPRGVLDLPSGFSYTIVSRAGELMNDGLRVPHAHDGMAAFRGAQGRIILVCNHELALHDLSLSAFSDGVDAIPAAVRNKLYDAGGGRSPGNGGTTTTIYNPATRETESLHLSLAGTELNCAGGPTPWGSWLSCEECFRNPGSSFGRYREQSHGYVFEVPAGATGLVDPVPLRAMGKFEHEAAAVLERTGIVYLTEDHEYSLLYRFIPEVPGQLQRGGRLQALAIAGRDAFATHNWSSAADIQPGDKLATHWIDLDNVDPEDNDLHRRGAALGAATFARGEGICAAGDSIVFGCTTGGRARLGQVFSYVPGSHEGSPLESRDPGQLTLIAEANHDSLLRNADNMAVAPWSDLIVCEDTASHCGLVGIAADGTQYAIADNAYSNSELAGVCFSPDGSILFVNIQYPGMTLAITGPWPAA